MNTTEPAGFTRITFDICKAVMLGSLKQYWSPDALRGITTGKQATKLMGERLKHGHENEHADHISPYVVQGCTGMEEIVRGIYFSSNESARYFNLHKK